MPAWFSGVLAVFIFFSFYVLGVIYLRNNLLVMKKTRLIGAIRLLLLPSLAMFSTLSWLKYLGDMSISPSPIFVIGMAFLTIQLIYAEEALQDFSILNVEAEGNKIAFLEFPPKGRIDLLPQDLILGVLFIIGPVFMLI